jgi:hypothetical protein
MKMQKLGVLGSSLALLAVIYSQLGQATEQPQESVLREYAIKLSQAFENFQDSQLSWFTNDFFRAVPGGKERVILGLKQNGQELGPLQRNRLCKMTGPYSGEVEFIAKNGKRLRAKLQLELQPPHRIVSLFVGNIDNGNDSWEALKRDLDRLPGHKSLSVCALQPHTDVFSYRADEPSAIGSSFKLLVLSAVTDQVASKKRHWSDVTDLRDDCRSLPSGILQDWPRGSPVTLHTLVTLMISRSDNTAVDHLIELLGRQAVEGHQVKAGVAHPERNQPFLKTSELFKLKLIEPLNDAEKFADATPKEKQLMLDKLRNVPLQSPRTLTKPTLINKVEWFFSTNDLCRILGQLLETPVSNDILPLLEITRPFDIDDYEWDYLGFKGGAEVGVFNISLLGKLRNNHRRYAVSLTWNRSDDALDEATWIRIAERALRLVEKQK